MWIARAPLEDWLRDRYFEAAIDISSSGVEPYSFGDLQSLLEIRPDELARVSFRDSRSAGSDHLRALVAQHCDIADESQVLVANGSTEAQFLVFAAILEPGDDVVVVEPAYHSLIATARALGCRVLSCRLKPEEGFRLDFDALRNLITSNTKAIVVNFPHNPTGATLTAAEQALLVEIADSCSGYLLWDGVFGELTYNDPPLPVITKLHDKGIDFGSLSKAHGLPGLRVGWAICPAEVIDRAVAVRDYTTLALSPLVEFVAGRVLASADRVLAPRLQQATTNRRVVSLWLEANRHALIGREPHAGVIVFPRLAVDDTSEFCRRMMCERGILLVPGECFHQPGHIRIGFGGDKAELREGLEGIAEELTKGCT